MKAYQLIYTACGKERTGSFSTWSKSKEITDTEENEIIAVMSYRTSENAPYNPTPEEIKKCFPRIYSCFVLSTGRKVLSTSTYIGPVYSDLDKRSGNFIIHALVFDIGLNPNPLSVFTSTQFKKELLSNEWKNDAPLYLEPIDYHDSFNVNENNIRNFVNTKNSDAIKGLLESAYMSLNNKGILVFNDTLENMITIYSLIYLTMPDSLLPRFSFSNQYSTNIEFTLTSNNTKRIPIRNPIDVNNYVPFTNDELVVNHFDFISGEVDDVKASMFIENAYNILVAKGLEETKKYIRFVKELQSKFSYSIEEILDIYNILNKNYSLLSSPSLICKTIKNASQSSLISFACVCNDVFNEYFVKGRLTYNIDSMELLKLCYKHLTPQQKTLIIRNIIKSFEPCGVTTNCDYESFVQSLKSTLGEMYDDLNLQLVNDLESRQLFIKSNNKNYANYIFDLSLNNLNKPGFKDIVCEYIDKLVNEKDLPELKLVFEKVGHINQQLVNEIVEKSLVPLYKEKVFDIDAFNNKISYFETLNEINTKKLFIILILSNIDNNNFIKLFINAKERNDNFEYLISLIKNEASVKPFFTKIECFEFDNKQNITLNDLSNYFNKHYLQNEDAGSFYNQVKRFLENCQSMKLENALSVYSIISNTDFAKFALWNVAIFVYDFILDQPLDSIAKLAPESYKKILDLSGKLSSGNRLDNKKLNVVKTYLLLNMRFGEQSNAEKINNKLVYLFLEKNQYDDFFRKYRLLIARFYLINKKKNLFEFSKLVEAVFSLPVIQNNCFVSTMLKDLISSNKNEATELAGDLLLYSYTFENDESQIIGNDMNNFFNMIGSHKTKSILNDNLKLFQNKNCEKLITYVAQYNSDHLSFFETIKLKLSKKEKK